MKVREPEESLDEGPASVKVQEPENVRGEDGPNVKTAGCGSALACAQVLWPSLWPRMPSPRALRKGHAPGSDREQGGKSRLVPETPRTGEYGYAPSEEWERTMSGLNPDGAPRAQSESGGAADNRIPVNGVGQSQARGKLGRVGVAPMGRGESSWYAAHELGLRSGLSSYDDVLDDRKEWLCSDREILWAWWAD